MKKKLVKTLLAMILAIQFGVLPVAAADNLVTQNSVTQVLTVNGITPYYNNVSAATLTIGFDMNNTVYCGFVIVPYDNCSGFSGVMKLYDSSGTRLKSWAITDYDRPYSVENTYQGVYGETYTVTFQGYAYNNAGGMYDDLYLEVTGHCIDAP